MRGNLLKAVFFILFLISIGLESYGQCSTTLTPITTIGSGTWTVPAGATSVVVEIWGAGGAGGRANGNPSSGGGGSGGGYIRASLSVTPGSNINYFVGSGGDGTTGGNGQSSWFQNNSTFLAVGGNGGGTINGNNSWGTGAAKVSSGNIGGNLASQYGGAGGNGGDNFSGGGGGSAGTGSDGNAGSGITGGSAVAGGFSGPNGFNTNSDGTAGSFGSGGSGGRTDVGTDRNGGNGGNGRIIITYTIPANTSSSSAPNQSVCVNSALTAITHTTTGATGIGAATGLPAGVTASWSSNTITISGTPTVTGTFNYSIPMTGGCTTGQSPATGTITVNPVASISNMPTTTCSGDAFTVTPANGTNGVVPAGTTYSWSAPVVTGGITGGAAGTGATNISGTLTNPTNTTQTATYTVTPLTGTCTGASFTVTVTVSPKPAVSNMTSSACSGDSFTLTPVNGTNGIVPAGTTYSWSAPLVTGGMTGGAAGTNATNISGTLTNPTNSAQTATYTVTPTSGSCTGSPFTVTVTVNPRPAVTNMASTVCSGDGFTVSPINGTDGVVPAGTTYSWSAPVVTGGLTGGTSGTGAASISGTLTNPTNTTQTATYTVTPTSGSCAGSPFTVTVSVSPKPAVTNMSTTVCSESGFTLNPTNGTNGIVPAGTTYTWSAPVVTGGMTGGTSGTNAANISGTLTNPTNTSQTATYTVTPTSGSCPGPTFTVSVTVSPKPTISNISSGVCSGEAFSVTPTNGTDGVVPAGTTYTWSAPTVTGGLTGGTSGTGATSISGTLTNPTNTTQTATYTVTPTSGSCAGSSFTVTVSVSPKPAVTNMSTTICSEDGFSLTPTNGTNGIVPAGTTYSWPAPVVTGGVTGGAAGSGANLISGTLTNPTNTVQTATYTVTPTSGGCAGAPFSVTVTINPKPTINNITTSTCTGGAFSSSPLNGTDGIVPSGVTYTWSAPVVTGGVTGGAAGSGAIISGTLTNPTSTPQTATYTVTPSTGSCTGIPFTVEVTVFPITAITTHPSTATQVECFGDGFIPISVSAVGGNLTYQWYSNPISSNSGGTIVPGATSASFTPPSTTQGSAYYYVVVTGACGTETSNVSGQFIVTPPITTITQNPSTIPQTVCLGGTFTQISVGAIGEGTVSYQWYYNTSASNTGGTLIPGATNPDYTPISDVVGTKYYYAMASSNCGTVPTDVSGAFTSTAPTEILTQNLAAQTICFGSNFTPISITAKGTGTVSYQWYTNTVANNTTGTAIPGATSASYTPPSGSVGTNYYYVIASSSCGPDQTSAASGAFTVNPLPVPTFTAAPSAPVCVGASTTYTTQSGQSNYNWSGFGTPGTDYNITSGGIGTTDNTVTVTWLTSGTKNISVSYTDPNGCTAVTSATNSLTVNPLPVPTFTAAPSAPICAGASTTYTTQPGQTNYTWSVPGVAGTDYTITSGGTGSTNNTVTITWLTSGPKNVTVGYTNSNGCTSITPASNNLTVNPLPVPTFTASPSPLVCLQQGITYTTEPGKSNYVWTVPGVAGTDYTITSGGIGNASSTVTLQWLTTGNKTVTVRYTEPTTGCVATATASSTTTVQPFATVGATSTAWPSVCKDSNPVLTPFTQPTTGVTGIGVPTGLPAGVTAVFNSTTGNIEFSGDVSTAATGLYNYSIPLVGNCINGLAATGVIDVTPVYNITAINSVSATTIGGNATVFFYGDQTSLLNGTYQVTYQIKQANGAFSTPITTTATVSGGRGTFSTIPITSNVDTYTVQLLSIKKSTDVCTIDLSSNPPTTYFGVCSAVYAGNGTFTVPANVFSITIEVYGGGGAGDGGGGGGGGYSIRQNIPVTPGEPLGVYAGAGGASRGANGSPSYVTRDSSLPNQATNSMVYAYGGNGSPASGNATGGAFDPRYSGSNGSNASGNNGGKGGGPLGGNGGSSGANGSNPGGGGGRWSGTRGRGGNGLVVISYSCPDADQTDCVKVIDDGAKSGTTVLEFTCDYAWYAPDGLSQFTVYVGGAGGGGGSGEGSGGGGSGSLIQQSFTTTSPYGLPSNSIYNISVGQGGLGAQSPNNNGLQGGTTTFSGPSSGAAGATASISVPGGGGGGSRAVNTGGSGSSGGGGSATPDPAKTSGPGGSVIPITYSGSNATVYQGNVGGNGDYSAPQNSVAGGGGGGLVPWGNGNDGQHGKAAGNGQGEGGRGGDGIVLNLGDSVRYFGAGGGGIGRYFNGTDKIGEGGLAGGIRIGGSGNLSGVNPVGTPGTNKTGSGGGAGYYGGGNGGSGVVYVVYVNVRILEVEFQNFTAKYDSENREGNLSWTTSKEWENSHFIIERSLNGIKDWTPIGQVQGAGYSDVPQNYTFQDSELPAAGGDVFYRLRQVDLSGKYSYSVTRSIQVEPVKGASSWVIYPNPTDGKEFHLEIITSEEVLNGEVNAMITTSSGQTQFFTDSDLERLSMRIGTYLQGKAAGVYVLSLSWNGKTESFRIIKK